MKIAVLLSGGVDSSVALALLKEQGHDIVAFYLKIWLEDELSYLGSCPWQKDLTYARAVCKQFSVPLEVISLQREYHERVVSSVVAEVKAGRTPNPDILCNQRIKFGAFSDKIDSSLSKIATGHYAQIEENAGNGSIVLKKSPDLIKDQTYFLSHLSRKQLERALFPIGHLCKSEVRAIAREKNLPTKDRKDSQGICFLGTISFHDFLAHHIGKQPGELIEYETGACIGSHDGFWFYTVGQRQGLGLSGGPWYVVSKDPEKNRVFISRQYYSAEKQRNSFVVNQCNWIVQPKRTDLTVKLRHGPYLNPCMLTSHENGDFSVTLSNRDQGIAPGQYAVFYDGDYCLGGGVIQERFIEVFQK